MEAGGLVGGNPDVLDGVSREPIQHMLLQAAIAPRTTLIRPTIYFASSLPATLTNHVEHILIATLGPPVLHLNSPPLLDDLVGMGLKLHHRRQISWDGIGGPNLRMDNAVKRPAQLLNCAQAGYRVFVS